MRYAEVRLCPGPEGFHPADRDLTNSEGLTRVAIHHVNQLDDGTVVLLYELQGTKSRAHTVLDAHDDVLAHSISPGSDPDSERGDSATRRTLHSYIHIDPNETLVSVFQLPQEHSLVIDTPIRCLPNGGITVVVMGDQPTITNAVGILPNQIETELLATGEYHPTDQTLYSQLTPRQQEILTVAVEAGYYSEPREITHEGLANRLDLAAVTVGEHLRKIEARIFEKIVR